MEVRVATTQSTSSPPGAGKYPRRGRREKPWPPSKQRKLLRLYVCTQSERLPLVRILERLKDGTFDPRCDHLVSCDIAVPRVTAITTQAPKLLTQGSPCFIGNEILTSTSKIYYQTVASMTGDQGTSHPCWFECAFSDQSGPRGG